MEGVCKQLIAVSNCVPPRQGAKTGGTSSIGGLRHLLNIKFTFGILSHLVLDECETAPRMLKKQVEPLNPCHKQMVCFEEKIRQKKTAKM